MLLRDVNNMTRYYSEFAPELLSTRYGEEMWALYEEGDLKPDTELTGLFQDSNENPDVDSVLEEIKAAFEEMQERRERMQEVEEDS